MTEPAHTGQEVEKSASCPRFGARIALTGFEGKVEIAMERQAAADRQSARQRPDVKQAKPHIAEEWVGKVYTTLCIGLLVVTIAAMVYFVASRGLNTFISNGVSLGGL